jgi:hypothetical protein
LSQNKKYFQATVYHNVAGHFCAIEFALHDIEPTETIIEQDCSKDIKMDWESKFMINKVNDRFFQIKDIIEFSDDSFHILKLNEYRNWHPAMAKLDLSEILDSILNRNEGTHV